MAEPYMLGLPFEKDRFFWWTDAREDREIQKERFLSNAPYG